MVLPVTGSPLHDSAMMKAMMAATTTAPAMSAGALPGKRLPDISHP